MYIMLNRKILCCVNVSSGLFIASH